MLWTWHSFDFNPPFYPVDRSKSQFLIRPACPDIRRAYEELDELLSLPTDVKWQFVWCYTTASWDDMWYERCLWPIDVPQESILAYVDSPIWEHLIGSKSVPKHIREQWEQVLFSQQVVGEQYYQEMRWTPLSRPLFTIKGSSPRDPYQGSRAAADFTNKGGICQ